MLFHQRLSRAFIIRRAVPVLKKTAPWFAIAVILAALPLIMQYLHTKECAAVFHWLRIFRGPYIVNAGIVTLLFLCFYAILNSTFHALSAVTLLCLTISIVDMQKMRILHQPLLPGDLLFFRQALLIAGIYAGQVAAGCALLAVIITGTILLRRKVPHMRLPPFYRVILAVILTATVAGILCNHRTVIRTINRRFGIVNEFWNQLSNFRNNGVAYGFIMNIGSLNVTKPPHYDKKAVDGIFGSGRTADTSFDTTVSGTAIDNRPLPDVIIYMNESFWDITDIKTIKPPRDPIPTFHRIGKKKNRQTLTKLVSPVFGGNTCIAEFEILTGMSHGFFPEGAIAYNQFIQRPIPSIVRVFRENGYRATAIHSFKKWFWNRVNVYRHLGFDSFISVESMDKPAIKGAYVSDEELAAQIINRIDADEKPQFIFALSMQNHGHYGYKRYDSLECPVETGLGSVADREYNTYFQGLMDADKSLRMITRYIDTTSRPSLLFFFGDHKPGFTDVYRETGYDTVMLTDTLCRYTVSGVWYSNFPLKPLEDTIVSMIYLPLLIAGRSGISLPRYYTDFLDSLRIRYPVFTGKNRTDRRSATFSQRRQIDTAQAMFRMVVYDALLGKNYSAPYHRIVR